MIKNLTQKVGIVTGMVVTNGLEGLKECKPMIALNAGLNILDQRDLVKGIGKTLKHTGIAGLAGGVVMTAVQSNEIKQIFKELDSEETEEVMEEE